MKKNKIVSLMLSATLFVAQLPVLLHQTEAKAEVIKVNEKSYAETKQKFTPIDLRSVANRGFADDFADDGKGGWTDQGSENDMRFFTLTGINTLKGVDFDIINPDTNNGNSVVVARGRGDMGVPTSVEIPVNDKGKGVYFLHASAWLTDICGYYTFVYEDGTEHDVPVRKDIDIFNWWGSGSSDTTITAWTGSNNATSAASLYSFAVANPYPDKTIKSIKVRTDGNGAYILLVAATLTDKGPYLWQDEDKSNVDTSDWWAYDMPMIDDIKGTALDMSFMLDAPAGKHGYIQTDGDKLLFEDGTPVQFWCANYVGERIFMSKEKADATADTLAALGYNLIRFHKMEAGNNGGSNIFISGTPQYDVDAFKMDQLAYFIYALKQRGIYVLIDGRVSGNIVDGGTIETGTYSLFYNDRMIERYRDYLRQIFNYYNPYTGMKIAEDPAVVFIDLANEVNTYGYTPTDKQIAKEIDAKFSKWLKEKYGTDEAIRNAWYYDGKEGVFEGESLEKLNYTIGMYSARTALSYYRQEDIVHFISDSHLNAYEIMESDLRSYGYKGLITVTTLYGSNRVSMTHVNAQSGFVDSHDYKNHPSVNNRMGTGSALGAFPTSIMANANLDIIGHFMNENVYGKPHTITEWEVCQMNPYLYEGSPLMAVFSCMQVWQPFYFGTGVNTFGIQDNGLEGGPIINYYDNYHPNLNSTGFFTSYDQPIQMAEMPVAGIVLERGDFKEAERGFYHRYSANDYWNNLKPRLGNKGNIGMIGKTGLSFDNVAYDEDYNDNEVLYRAVMSEKLGKPFVSITGEVETDIENNTFRANSERTQYVLGTIGGKTLEVDDMIVQLDTEKCAVSLTSIDGMEPIWDADKALLTVAGDARNSGEVRSADGLTILQGGTTPILVEPIVGRVTLKTKDELEIYKLASSGERKGLAKTQKDADGNTVLILTPDDCCLNYEIVRVKRAEGERGANEHIVFEPIEYKSLFDDIGFDHWAYKAVERNCLQDIMTGVSETEFGPEKPMTRGDFTATIIDSLGVRSATHNNEFADVPKGSRNYDDIMLAKYWGIVSGDENGNFRPNDPITRTEAIVILDKAMELMKQPMKATDNNVLSNYTDSDKLPDYAVDAAKAMLSQRYFNELFSSEIDPAKALTRAEAAWIIYGVLWYEV